MGDTILWGVALNQSIVSIGDIATRFKQNEGLETGANFLVFIYVVTPGFKAVMRCLNVGHITQYDLPSRSNRSDLPFGIAQPLAVAY